MKKMITKRNKQQGATLITALMMLLVMTILGISAVKMSSIDILIAGNDQQKLMLMQETDSDLNNLATPGKLIDPLVGTMIGVIRAEFDADTNIYTVPNPRNPLSTETITDMKKDYSCKGFSGKAISVSSDMACRLYDFKVKARKANSGAREQRRRGAGKQVPSECKNSTLC